MDPFTTARRLRVTNPNHTNSEKDFENFAK